MKNGRAGVAAAVMLGVAAVIGIALTLFSHAFLSEYGPTNGSRLDGALAGLTGGAVVLLLVAALAVTALLVHRASVPTRAVAVTVIVLSVAGTAISGALAAASKYERLPRVPDCGVGTVAGNGPRTLQDAYGAIAHPAPFGAVSSSISACRGDLLDVGFAQAATHYRTTLPAAGWEITQDAATRLAARRGELAFELAACEPTTVTIELASGEGLGNPC